MNFLTQKSARELTYTVFTEIARPTHADRDEYVNLSTVRARRGWRGGGKMCHAMSIMPAQYTRVLQCTCAEELARETIPARP